MEMSGTLDNSAPDETGDTLAESHEGSVPGWPASPIEASKAA